MNDFAACWQVASQINGWLTRAEAAFLFSAARNVPHGGVIVEIGSFFGRSTVCLARGSRTGARAPVIAIDPQFGSPKHEHLLRCADPSPWLAAHLERAGVTDVVSVRRQTSAEAAEHVTGPIDLLFIDGSHELADVRDDFARWFPKLRVGGCVAFHDSWHMQGVRRATAAILSAPHPLRAPLLVDTITACTKSDQPARHRGYLAARWLRGPAGFLRLTYGGGTRLRPVEKLGM